MEGEYKDDKVILLWFLLFLEQERTGNAGMIPPAIPPVSTTLLNNQKQNLFLQNKKGKYDDS